MLALLSIVTDIRYVLCYYRQGQGFAVVAIDCVCRQVVAVAAGSSSS